MRSRHESNTHTRRHQQRCFIPAFISFLISSDYLLLTPKFRTIFGTTVRVFIGTHLLAISLHSAPPNTKPLFRNCNRPETNFKAIKPSSSCNCSAPCARTNYNCTSKKFMHKRKKRLTTDTFRMRFFRKLHRICMCTFLSRARHEFETVWTINHKHICMSGPFTCLLRHSRSTTLIRRAVVIRLTRWLYTEDSQC